MTYTNQHLTQFVKAAGCAAKLDSHSLQNVTNLLQAHPLVLSGINTNEDSSIFFINEDLALVQTLDFITPIVDCAYHFGAIAAANALSDVFAMGGEVMNALNIVGFDNVHFDEQILSQILQGANEKIKECGGVLVGGHTITSAEMFFGLSVTGKVAPKAFFANNTAKSGDVIMLTKPIGTGILSTALKADMLENTLLDKWLEMVSFLNVYASRILREFEPNAMTDVTGFGLLGHLKEMLNSSICIELYKDKVPVFEGVKDKMNLGLIPGGAYKNQKSIQSFVRGLKDEPDDMLLFDPQTSGGLLCALNPDKALLAQEKLAKEGINAAIIAHCVASNEPCIRVA